MPGSLSGSPANVKCWPCDNGQSASDPVCQGDVGLLLGTVPYLPVHGNAAEDGQMIRKGPRLNQWKGGQTERPMSLLISLRTAHEHKVNPGCSPGTDEGGTSVMDTETCQAKITNEITKNASILKGGSMRSVKTSIKITTNHKNIPIGSGLNLQFKGIPKLTSGFKRSRPSLGGLRCELIGIKQVNRPPFSSTFDQL